MVKPAFTGIDVQVWRSRKKFKGTEPYICLFHESRELGMPILEVLRELEVSELPARRTLTFTTRQQPERFRKMQLVLVDSTEDLRVMHVSCAEDAVVVQLTLLGLDVFREGLQAWFKGSEDFCVSVDQASLKRKQLGRLDRASGELWFWGPGYAGP